MAVMIANVSRPKPGRLNDAVAMAVEAAKLCERHGAADPRLLVAGMAGEGSGTHAFSLTFETGEAMGAFVDGLQGDAEWEAYVTRLDAADSPVTLQSRVFVNELPTGRTPRPGRGRIVENYVSRLVPGRLEGMLELTNVAFDFLEAHGATSCRLGQLAGGMLNDALVATWELESMQAYGRATDAFTHDPDAQALTAMLTSADCPIVPISGGVYTEIPL